MRLAISQVLTCWIEVCTRFGTIVLHANGGTIHEELTVGISRLITIQG
jgi:hypothetical protein